MRTKCSTIEATYTTMSVFQEGLYLKIAYPESIKKQVLAIVPWWQQFCALPPELKNRFVFADHPTLDTGYKLRSEANYGDSKEHFHFAAPIAPLLEHYRLSEMVQKEPVLRNFLEAGDVLQKSIGDFAKSIATDLETQIPGVQKQTEKGAETIVVRFLHYFGKGDILAQPHFDRSGFTLHLYESHPGLQFLTFQGEWRDAPMDETGTMIFPGHKMEVLSKGKVQKVWHRVSRPTTAESEHRYSAVAFVSFPDVAGYDATARSQDEKPGYAPAM